jgi:hypothetical protein
VRTMLILLMLANATDATLTARNATQPRCYELNPALRPAFRAGPAAIGVTIGGASVLEWMAARRLARRHRRWARLAVAGALGGEAWGIAVSAQDEPKGR